MLKKVFSFIIAISLILFTTCVFAADNSLGNSLNNVGDSLRNVVGGAENVVKDAGGTIGADVQDIGNAVADGGEMVTNGVDNVRARMTTNNNGNSDEGMMGSNYNTTRTATGTTNNGTFMGMSGNTWTWLILGVVAIAIVGLVWYYASQNKNEYDENHQ